MRVFIVSVVAIIVITAVSAIVLTGLDASSAERFQIKENVRL
jgi:hypothetical protein